MLIVCRTIDDFFENIDAAIERGEKVWRDTIHYDRVSNKVNDSKHDDRRKYVFQLFATLVVAEDEHLPIACGIDLGVFPGEDGEHEDGKAKQDRCHIDVIVMAADRELNYLPGVIDTD